MSRFLKNTLKYSALFVAGLFLFSVAPALTVFSLFIASLVILNNQSPRFNWFWPRSPIGVDQYVPVNAPVVYPMRRPFSPPFNPTALPHVHHHPCQENIHRHSEQRPASHRHGHPSTPHTYVVLR